MYTYRKVKVKSLSHIWLFVTPSTVAYQASLSMGFSRQEYWSGLPFPSPGDPDPGIKPGSPTLEADSVSYSYSHEPPECSPPGSSVHGLLQARILEWVAISFSRGSRPRDRTPVSCIAGRFFTVWATREGRCLISLWETGNMCCSHGHDEEETNTEDALEKLLLSYQQTALEKEEKQKGLEGFRVWWLKW